MPASSARRHASVAALLVGLLLVLVGCGTPPGPPDGTNPDQANLPGPTSTATATEAAPEPTPTPTPTPVSIRSNVADGATDVTVDTIVELTAAQGTLTKVTVSALVENRTSGKFETVTVPGSFTKDRTGWKATDGLDPSSEYTVEIEAEAPDGFPSVETRTFTTHDLSLDQQTFGSIYPLDGMRVGVGMPAIVRFDIPVTDKAEVEKHLHLTATPKQAGSWYWVSDSEVHYRPKTYWKAGTKITVDARLNGVKAGKNLYGQESRTWSFTIGRKVFARIDLSKQIMGVYVDDKRVRIIKVSAGKKGFITRSGVKVISEKLRTTRMTSETSDISDPEYYDLETVEYAMRLTNSGEFFHAAPWNSSNFGRANVSHGCTGMSNADAKWLYATMNVGDPAEFRGSKRGMEAGNGYTDWNLSWKQVQQKSAL